MIGFMLTTQIELPMDKIAGFFQRWRIARLDVITSPWKTWLNAARKIITYAQGATRETLPSIPMRLDAMLCEIVVMGEGPAVLRNQSAIFLPKCLGGIFSR